MNPEEIKQKVEAIRQRVKTRTPMESDVDFAIKQLMMGFISLNNHWKLMGPCNVYEFQEGYPFHLAFGDMTEKVIKWTRFHLERRGAVGFEPQLRFLFEVNKIEVGSDIVKETLKEEALGTNVAEARDELLKTLASRNKANKKYDFVYVRDIETVGDIQQSWAGMEERPLKVSGKSTGFTEDDIIQIEKEQADFIIETRSPRGLFYLQDGDKHIGIDNRDGNAWTEEFNDPGACKRYLLGEDEDEYIIAEGTESNGIKYKGVLVGAHDAIVTVWFGEIKKREKVTITYEPRFGFDVSDTEKLNEVTDRLIKEVEEEMNK